jgi:hypothetical protein
LNRAESLSARPRERDIGGSGGIRDPSVVDEDQSGGGQDLFYSLDTAAPDLDGEDSKWNV